MTDDSDDFGYDPWPDHIAELKAILLPIIRQHFDKFGANFAEAHGVRGMSEVVHQVLAERGVKR